MSKIKMSAIALAVTAAFGLSAAASAATLAGPGTNGAPAQVVFYTVANGHVETGSAAYSLSIVGADNLAGRTTGMGIRLVFPQGVKVASLTVSAGAGASTANPTDGSASVSSGIGTNEVTINLIPGTGGLNTSAPILSISNLVLDGATQLDADGGSLAVSAVLYDPNTSQVLGQGVPATTMITAGNPVQLTATANSSNARIDVGSSGAGNTNNLPKVVFSGNGSINGNDRNWFKAGTLTSALTTGMLDASDGSAYTSIAPGDTISGTMNGHFGGFVNSPAGVVLSTTGCNSPSPVTGGVGTVTANSVTFAGVPASPGSVNVCFLANGTDAIDATTVEGDMVFHHGNVAAAPQHGELQSLEYNGSSVNVATFNPGANASQQSFLRVINNGSINGKVTIYGFDQNGTRHGPVTFNLDGGHSMQINSDDMADGNSAKFSGALGTGVGKWRLDVTGEFDGLEVQSLMRNNASGTVSNLSGSIK